MTASNKIQIRAQVLQSILKFKSAKFPSDIEVEECIKTLNKVNDKKFVTELLLKEITATNEIYDSVLTLLLFNISSPKMLLEAIFPLLNKNSVPDVKKLYLINILREQGQKIDYDFIQSHIKNPDEIIDNETKKFLDEAKISPETKIDFFDFYFTVNPNDRDMLISSIIDDYSGDGLANILSPFAYFYPNVLIDEKIIQALADSKSYFALEALNWCSKNCGDKKLAQLAKKSYKKMSLMGFDTNIDKKEVYAQLLKNSKPLGFWYSCADGNSNISCVFAREKDKGTIQTFFTVFNLQKGPISTFGFDEVTKKDFEVILLRFFKSSLHAKLSAEEGKLIFDTLSSRGWSGKTVIPYEFICWREITYDTNAKEINFHDLLKENLEKNDKAEKLITKILNSDLFSSWYYNCENHQTLSKLVQNIDNYTPDIKQIEQELNATIKEMLADTDYIEKFKEKIYFQCYILKKTNMQNSANILYSATLDTTMLEKLLTHIIKKSVYAHFLQKTESVNATENIFIKKRQISNDNKNAKEVIKTLEENWSQWI